MAEKHNFCNFFSTNLWSSNNSYLQKIWERDLFLSNAFPCGWNLVWAYFALSFIIHLFIHSFKDRWEDRRESMGIENETRKICSRKCKSFFLGQNRSARKKSQESMVKENETQERCSRKWKKIFLAKTDQWWKVEIRCKRLRREKNVQENAKVFLGQDRSVRRKARFDGKRKWDPRKNVQENAKVFLFIHAPVTKSRVLWASGDAPTDQPTNWPTNKPTDCRTHPLIEL